MITTLVPRTLALAAPLLLLCACSGPTGVADADARFNGAWTYAATQAGSATTVTGTLALSGAESGTIEGSLDAQQQEPGGPLAPLSGLVSGTVSASGVARIEITLSGGRLRTHYVQLKGDSLTGDWVESGSSPASGAFRAARRTP